MKKLVFYFILCASLCILLFATCSVFGVHRWSWISPETNAIEDYCGLSVYVRKDIYSVVVNQHGPIEKGVDFTADRKSIYTFGINLLDINSPADFLGMSWNEAEAILGPYHAAIGSGFFRPAYITTDCYLIVFSLYKEVIVGIDKRDLQTGECVESFQDYSHVFEDCTTPN